jgi:hypothetical protein
MLKIFSNFFSVPDIDTLKRHIMFLVKAIEIILASLPRKIVYNFHMVPFLQKGINSINADESGSADN